MRDCWNIFLLQPNKFGESPAPRRSQADACRERIHLRFLGNRHNEDAVALVRNEPQPLTQYLPDPPRRHWPPEFGAVEGIELFSDVPDRDVDARGFREGTDGGGKDSTLQR